MPKFNYIYKISKKFSESKNKIIYKSTENQLIMDLGKMYEKYPITQKYIDTYILLPYNNINKKYFNQPEITYKNLFFKLYVNPIPFGIQYNIQKFPPKFHKFFNLIKIDEYYYIANQLTLNFPFFYRRIIIEFFIKLLHFLKRKILSILKYIITFFTDALILYSFKLIIERIEYLQLPKEHTHTIKYFYRKYIYSVERRRFYIYTHKIFIYIKTLYIFITRIIQYFKIFISINPKFTTNKIYTPINLNLNPLNLNPYLNPLNIYSIFKKIKRDNIILKHNIQYKSKSIKPFENFIYFFEYTNIFNGLLEFLGIWMFYRKIKQKTKKLLIMDEKQKNDYLVIALGIILTLILIESLIISLYIAEFLFNIFIYLFTTIPHRLLEITEVKLILGNYLMLNDFYRKYIESLNPNIIYQLPETPEITQNIHKIYNYIIFKFDLEYLSFNILLYYGILLQELQIYLYINDYELDLENIIDIIEIIYTPFHFYYIYILYRIFKRLFIIIYNVLNLIENLGLNLIYIINLIRNRYFIQYLNKFKVLIQKYINILVKFIDNIIYFFLYKILIYSDYYLKSKYDIDDIYRRIIIIYEILYKIFNFFFFYQLHKKLNNFNIKYIIAKILPILKNVNILIYIIKFLFLLVIADIYMELYLPYCKSQLFYISINYSESEFIYNILVERYKNFHKHFLNIYIYIIILEILHNRKDIFFNFIFTIKHLLFRLKYITIAYIIFTPILQPYSFDIVISTYLLYFFFYNFFNKIVNKFLIISNRTFFKLFKVFTKYLSIFIIFNIIVISTYISITKNNTYLYFAVVFIFSFNLFNLLFLYKFWEILDFYFKIIFQEKILLLKSKKNIKTTKYYTFNIFIYLHSIFLIPLYINYLFESLPIQYCIHFLLEICILLNNILNFIDFEILNPETFMTIKKYNNLITDTLGNKTIKFYEYDFNEHIYDKDYEYEDYTDDEI